MQYLANISGLLLAQSSSENAFYQSAVSSTPTSGAQITV